MKTFQYRLEPTKAQAVALQWRLDRCRELYNACLEERREAWWHGVVIDRMTQQRQLREIKRERTEYGQIDAQVLEEVVARVDRAYKAFFRRCRAASGAPGFPRFKGRDRYDSFTHRQSGWKLEEGRLYLAGIGRVKIRLSRPIVGQAKTVTVRRDCGKWYVGFACSSMAEPVQLRVGPAIGVDVGLTSFATLSDGTQIDNPRFFRRTEAVIARRQRSALRHKKGSKRQAKARQLVAKAHRKVRNQRRDFQHKLARSLVNRYALIAVERLNVCALIRNGHLSKAISDAGWASFLSCIEYKAGEAGTRFVKVNPSGTSQTCLCGARVEKDLSQRWHDCPVCGLSLPRDQVSAMLILGRADPSGQLRIVPQGANVNSPARVKLHNLATTPEWGSGRLRRPEGRSGSPVR